MSNRRVEAFLLRLVVEGGAADEPCWRGRIQHVSSGYEQQFERVQDMLAFISEQFAAEPPKPRALDRFLQND